MINQFLLKEFGTRVKTLRANKKLSQEALSRNTGFHRTYIGMIERGERNISLINIAVFAKAFEISISQLLDFASQQDSRPLSDYETKSGN
ncbi:helix-turn-helix transcriptional regulator [Mucilaginibacter mali]|uniref:Helix-turn-helix transcriptional regulator n=1 Tax=Mucilaginibacter mali TaxID=2740462 RepID=A0A7D4QMF5_9SPHI|nr:helix-turn-helix transcriptional regulator [Mucilaginibacter mali]QKJ31750.1 helix-turn-helix transcriptional regulator [Mucilaginibacter mali]